MARNQKDFTFDAKLLLQDVTAAITASAAGTVATVAKVLDVGAARLDARVIVDVSSIDTVTGDESYRIRIQGSNTADLSTGVVELAALELGGATPTGDTAADAVGRREIAFTNEVNGVVYRYIRVYALIAGTTPSLIYTAFVVQQF
jgi:hypothetical protein